MTSHPPLDPRFTVEVVRSTPNPQQAMWMALHQCYSEDLVCDRLADVPTETEAGRRAVKLLLAGNRGHFGITESPSIVFNVGNFPHSVMQQLRTHRVGLSMAVQSMRYTGDRIIDAANGDRDIEDVFYLRPMGHYNDRQSRYFYSQEQRNEDLALLIQMAKHYACRRDQGVAAEHARGLIPFDFRQHFMLTLNARSLMHILDLRAKADAQLEIQQLCQLLMPKFHNWMPAIAQWYETNRLGKARLAP